MHQNMLQSNEFILNQNCAVSTIIEVYNLPVIILSIVISFLML